MTTEVLVDLLAGRNAGRPLNEQLGSPEPGHDSPLPAQRRKPLEDTLRDALAEAGVGKNLSDATPASDSEAIGRGVYDEALSLLRPRNVQARERRERREGTAQATAAPVSEEDLQTVSNEELEKVGAAYFTELISRQDEGTMERDSDLGNLDSYDDLDEDETLWVGH